MKKFNSISTTFYLRQKDDLLSFYKRIDFWVCLLSLVFIVLSLCLERYADTTYEQMLTHTKSHWALVLGGVIPMIGIVYIFVTTFLFRNSAVLSGINIGLGLLMTAFVVMEYAVLKNGYSVDGEVLAMSNKPAVGYYLAIIGSVMTVALEFYKLGGQGYYSAQDIQNEKASHDVEVVDGVVIVDGEAVPVSDKNIDNNAIENKSTRLIENNEDKSVENNDKILIEQKSNNSDEKVNSNENTNSSENIENNSTTESNENNDSTSPKA